MQVQINAGDVDSSEALRNWVQDAIDGNLEHLSDRITRIEVHLRDDNAGKAGSDDKRCLMEARMAGRQPIAVDDRSDDLYRSINEAARKLAVVVQKQVDKEAPA